VDGVMWYDIEVTNESGRCWTVQRRYNDFAQLDGDLKKSRSLEVPELPGKEVLNPLKVFAGALESFPNPEKLESCQKDVRTSLMGIEL
ncbi:unnamed protein product, partial [Symbiodinium sp. CCMP2456]